MVGPPVGSTASPTEAQPTIPTTHIKSSPWIRIPKARLICVEHPAVIRNLDNGIATVGGQQALIKLAETNGMSGLHLRLRPKDPMQPPIESRTVNTNNVLLKITIPRRRKKKSRNLASNGSESAPAASSRGGNVLEKLKASKGNFEVEAVGMIERTVRFRDMANFQWNTSRSHFVEKLKDTLLTTDYERILQFRIAPDKGTRPGVDILPPPALSNTAIPHTYHYRQNPAVKKALIDGQTALYNLQAAPKTLTPTVHVLDPEVPSEPPPGVVYERLDAVGKECVDHIRRLFEQRPIWTRRGLFNHLPEHIKSIVRFHICYVAYMWRAGPWRDTCVIYGLDPRKDPNYRKYQSLQFQMNVSKPRSGPEQGSLKSHIFDGQNLTLDGRVFQLCDVSDPLLQDLINVDSIRKKCDPVDGWYRASTLSKVKGVMRAKIINMVQLRPINNADYVNILEQESEDEDQEAERKDREEKQRVEKRQQRAKAKELNPAESAAQAPGVEEEKDDAEAADGDYDVDGEWEEELDMPTGHVDERVQQLMTEFMAQGEDQGFDLMDEDEEGDFDILGDDDDEDEE